MTFSGSPGASPASFVLVPGFWLGSWAWDRVAESLRVAGHHVEAVTLPGLQGRDVARSGIGLSDHIAAVAKLAAAGPGVILVGHSGAGSIVHAVTDQLPGQILRAVYVDSGPLPDGIAINPDLDPAVTEIPLPSWAELEAGGSSLAGLDQAMLAEFRERAVPHPAGPVRDRLHLAGVGSRDVPVTMILTSYRADDVADLASRRHPYFSELTRMHVTYVDLPTGHWPMWSRPDDLTSALLDTATAAARPRTALARHRPAG